MRTARPTVALLLAVALLTACTDDPPPPAPAPSPTSPATPRPTLPVQPAEASEFTARGLASFTGYYVQLMDFASKTGNVQELQRVSASRCDGCSDYIELFEQIYARGGIAVGRNWTISGSEIRFYDKPLSESFVTTTLRITAGTIAPSDSAAPTSHPPVESQISFGSRFIHDEWVMTQLGTGGIS